MHINYHHIHHRRKRLKAKSAQAETVLSKLVDKSVYLLVVAGIAANIPQLTKIWSGKNTAGVSLITWLGFLAGSLFWLFYGFIHKEKPIIISNFFFVLIQLFIVLGLIFNNNSL